MLERLNATLWSHKAGTGRRRHRHGAMTAVPAVLAGLLLGGRVGFVAAAGIDHTGLPDLPAEMRELVDTAGGGRGVLGGLFNPGAWAVQPSGGLYLGWSDLAGRGGQDWTAIAATRGLGLGWRRLQVGEGVSGGSPTLLNEYTLGASAGDRSGGVGLSYAWAPGTRSAAGPWRDDRLTAGLLRRWRPAALGLLMAWSLQRSDYVVAADLGVRPVGPRLTLFGDVTVRKGATWDDLHAGYGARVEALPGLSLAAKAQDTGEVSLGLTVGWGPRERLSLRQHLDGGGDREATTYALEWGSPEPDLPAALAPAHRTVVALELQGPMSYRRYRYLDDRRTLLGTLAQLASAGRDRRVRAVAVNLSGMRVPLELQWELRRQLAGLRAQGKTVVAYVDRAGLFETMLASVADQVWLDPFGSLQLMGMASGRTYYKHAAEKLGIGVEELRFFTYKSAMEGYARSGMSQPDREQRQVLLDDLYETAVGAITTARGMPRERWDRLVEDKGMLLPEEALAEGLIDSLGAWDRALKAARTATSRAGGGPTPSGDAATLPGVLGDPTWTWLEWGEPARVAVVYAVGPTEMDSGMRGRQLARELKRARESRHVKAVVLRADSPGGDPLASDIVAREMQATAKRKPMLVSQGQVAASGGYWISMEGQTIFSTPVTLTGSIGVIAGHAWNDSLGRKLGLDYDGVKRGAHADLYQGIRLPLAPLPLPDRPLTQFERQRAEQLIRAMYAQFVGRVAQARRLNATYVDSVGQGRVWSGTRARQLGLVDQLGGLWDALRLAKQQAGLAADAPLAIDESPRLGWFNLESLRPRIPLWGLVSRGSADTAAPGAVVGGEAPDAAEEAGVGPGAESQFLQRVLATPLCPLTLQEPIEIDGGGGARERDPEW